MEARQETAGAMDPAQLRSDMDTIKQALDGREKENEVHRVIVVAGNAVTGLLLLIGVPFLLLAVGIVGVATPATPPGEPSPTLIVGGAVFVALAILVVLALPFLLAAWGVFRRRSWGTVMAVIAAVLNLGNIPLGTAFGIYSIWAVAQGKLATRP